MCAHSLAINRATDLLLPFSLSLSFIYYKMAKNNYAAIIDNNDTSASSISSIPALSVFSDIGASLDEQRPLLTNSTVDSSICSSVEVCFEEPSATIASAAINLSNTILGTGMLAMVK